jgi:hypothetical protein
LFPMAVSATTGSISAHKCHLVDKDYSSKHCDVPISAYEDTPVGELRTRMAAGRFAAKTGDPDKVTQAMIDAMDREPPPRLITLGSIAYDHMETALTDKLAVLRAQKELAYSVDAE